MRLLLVRPWRAQMWNVYEQTEHETVFIMSTHIPGTTMYEYALVRTDMHDSEGRLNVKMVDHNSLTARVAVVKGEKIMSNLYSVEDTEGHRHIVAASAEGEAVRAVQAHINADQDYYDGDVNDGANAQFLGATDLIPAGTVLSGLSAARQEENATSAKQANTSTTGKATTSK